MEFRDLPGYPPLFLDFVEGAPSARSLLGGPVGLDEAADRLRRFRPISPALPEIAEKVSRLSHPDTVAVLATVPPSLFGGPLRLLLKVLSACRLAAEFRSRGIDAVPVCWVSSDALDQLDRNAIWVLDTEYRLKQVSSSGGATIETLLSQIDRIAPDRQPTLELLKNNYEGHSFSSGFCRFISALTTDWGMVAIDAEEPALRSIVSARRDSIAREASPSGEAASLLPVVQASILPVGVHVLDPGEFSNWALIRPVFERLRLHTPVIWPRAGATVVDSRSRKFLDRHGLRLKDLFASNDTLLARVTDQAARESTARRLEALEDDIRQHLSEFAARVPPEETLKQAIETSREKMLYQSGKLKDQFFAASRNRSETERRHLERACNTLAPAGRVQEQVLGTVHFLLRYSPAFAAGLYHRLEPGAREHQIISMD